MELAGGAVSTRGKNIMIIKYSTSRPTRMPNEQPRIPEPKTNADENTEQ